MRTHHINILRLANYQKGGGVFVGAIADLNVTAFDDTTITLDWTTPSADNPIDYYEVWLDGVFYENTTDASEGWVVTGLTAGTSYDITLKAVDDLGNKSGFSNEVSFVTEAPQVNTLLTKTASSGWGNAGAESTLKLVGDGYVDCEAIDIINATVIGLSYTNIDNNRSSINYCVNLNAQGNLVVFESGTNRLTSEPYLIGDIIRVERIGTSVHYKKNGTIFYTSPTPATTADMIGDCALNQNGSKLSNAKMNGQIINWINVVGCTLTVS